MAIVQPQRQPVAPAPVVVDPEAHLGITHNGGLDTDRHVHHAPMHKRVSIVDESDGDLEAQPVKADPGLMLSGKPIRRTGSLEVLAGRDSPKKAIVNHNHNENKETQSAKTHAKPTDVLFGSLEQKPKANSGSASKRKQQQQKLKRASISNETIGNADDLFGEFNSVTKLNHRPQTKKNSVFEKG